ncbi:hypothetical protein SAMN02910301_2108 [Lachnospiraceae bacterium XBD2001]|nr:hypothetical protein SAMN02910301_2108 [Lachnospiraceae bacterium XBD2001]
MDEMGENVTYIDEKLFVESLNNRNLLYESENDLDTCDNPKKGRNTEEGQHQEQGGRHESNNNPKEFAETDEEFLQIASIVASIHGEASFINAVVYMNSESHNEVNLDMLHKLEGNEMFFVELECFFINEIKRYYANRKIYENEYKNSLVEHFWRKALKNKSDDNIEKSIYPVRKRIENIFYAFIKLVNEYVEGDNYKNDDSLSGLNNDITDSEEFVNLVYYAKSVCPSKRKEWLSFIKSLNAVLSFCRSKRAGSIGHLLWIILYFNELLYFRSTGEKYKSAEEIKRIKESQPPELWEPMDGGEESFHSLLRTLSLLFYENQSKTISLINSDMLMCYMGSPGIKSPGEEEYERAKSILYRDQYLRKIFVHERYDSHIKKKCFAVLTNGKGTNYLAICGNKDLTYNSVKAIFMSKCAKGTAYTVIDRTEYGESEYRWSTSARPHGVITKKEADRESKVNGIRKPSRYRRMFSCAERRLVQRYENEPDNTEFVIYSRWSPCYMCERVLKHHKIKCVDFGEYNMVDEDEIKEELDGFAERLAKAEELAIVKAKRGSIEL